MSSSISHWIRRSHIATIEFNSPSNRNALSLPLLKEFHQIIQKMETNPDIRVIILQSQGPTFSSGHDLKEIQKCLPNNKTKELRHLFELCSATMQSIETSTKPFIAKVDGVATAAGCQLVASCDLAYASKRSRFATPGVNIGLFCSTPAVAISRCGVGKKKAMEMLLTGEMISADTAEEFGLINAALPEDSLNEKVDAMADLIATKSPKAIQLGKPAFAHQMKLPIEEAYALASKVMLENILEDECKEGINSFLRKRKPRWGEE